MRVSGAVTATALLRLGGPAMLADWLFRGGHDGATALRACPRADWLVWLAAVDGASDAQLLGAAIAAVRTVLPLVPEPSWPLEAALAAAEGGPCTHVPTAADLAAEVVSRQGVAQRVALAVRSVQRATLSHRTIAVRIFATTVTAAAVADAQVRHRELAALSTREAVAFVDRACGARDDRQLEGPTLPLGVVAVLRHLRALVPTVRPLLERVDVSTGAG